jgi:hypothetical protein
MERSCNFFSNEDYFHHNNKIWDLLEVDELVPDVTASKDESSMRIQQEVGSKSDNCERRFVTRKGQSLEGDC